MVWFRREPPPPPPKSKIPGWVGIATPIIFAVILGLLGIVYNGLAEEVKEKVDNKTLQLMIEKQEIKFKALIDAIKNTQDQQRQIQAPSVPQAPVQSNALTQEQINYYFSLTPSQRQVLKQAEPKYSVLP